MESQARQLLRKSTDVHICICIHQELKKIQAVNLNILDCNDKFERCKYDVLTTEV